jgi:hypothetical protein
MNARHERSAAPCPVELSRREGARVIATVLAGMVVALLLGFGPALAQAQAPNDHRIVPRERIGAAALGETATELIAALGEPSSVWPGPVYTYNWREVSATVIKEGWYATQICTNNPAYTTDQGVRPGSSSAAVEVLLGQPRYSRLFKGWWRQSYTNLYWPGLTVTVHLKGFDTDNQVWKICVNHSAAIPQ